MEDGLAIDWENLLENGADDLNFKSCNQSCADGFSNTTDWGCSLSIDDVEEYLLNDEFDYPKEDDQIAIEDAFFSDVLLDSAPESESDRSKNTSSSPESAVVATEVEENEEHKPRDSSADVEQTKEKNDVPTDDGDPAAKKRKRQMRNRDAAVRSRERKKMYVTDLERKSKFYEAECRRLGILLQCSIAENQALRLSLHSTKAFDASMAKQESAVLILESLLLGSLLGHVGIIMCLLMVIFPEHPLSTVVLRNGVGAESGRRRRRDQRRKEGNNNNSYNNKVGLELELDGERAVVMMGRRCRGSRSRMKMKQDLIFF
ncbi:bZIP transcription factor 50 [Andrographis paniculata]|uniref:bZIP transcription factor 50 n=1 Tax=Andrographis paniculata TaxID=175694 RepID=UPI0021E8CC99|nr:bZIP transcription factor 50 [Andrographis paniculata]